jgi:ribonuclease BN (tRNA processing enzyme)
VIYRVEHGARSITFSGDIDAHGLPALAAIALPTNLLVFNAVVLDPPGSPEILYSLHTPPAAIGELAARARADTVLLSHLSPAVDGARAAVTASIARHFKGRLSFAEDLLRLKP